jgi:SNW domain-containing protein 1
MGDHRKINNCLPINVNINGDINYRLLLNCNSEKNSDIIKSNDTSGTNTIIKTSNDAAMSSNNSEFNSEVKETMVILQNRIAAITNKGGAANFQTFAPYFVTYDPNLNFSRSNRTCERLLQIQEMIPDPMEPPKHKIIKVPRGPLGEPVPVMHSPPNAVEYKEAVSWKIPPAVSNWKNSKGYIIPLDKRLAVDGRILQETKINDNFAKLSEALYIAERKAQEETELRNWVAKENLIGQKERKNAEMRALALNARIDKKPSIFSPPQKQNNSRILTNTDYQSYQNSNIDDKRSSHITVCESRNQLESRKQYKARNEIRKHKNHLRERERRMLDAGEHGYRRNKLTRDSDRDIGERLALGMIQPPHLKYEQNCDDIVTELDSDLIVG